MNICYMKRDHTDKTAILRTNFLANFYWDNKYSDSDSDICYMKRKESTLTKQPLLHKFRSHLQNCYSMAICSVKGTTLTKLLMEK